DQRCGVGLAAERAEADLRETHAFRGELCEVGGLQRRLDDHGAAEHLHAGRTVSHERCAAIASAFTPDRSLGRPGRCTSDADIIIVTAPCIELSIQPIIDCRGVQSANTTCAWESISPGA